MVFYGSPCPIEFVWSLNFPQHCQLVPDEQLTSSPTNIATISAQAFTPILGTFLLSANPVVGGAARYAIVDLLTRLKKADENHLAPLDPNQVNEDADGTEWAIGLFLWEEREMFRNEIIQQIVIGMARLDMDMEDPNDDGFADMQCWEDDISPSEQKNFGIPQICMSNPASSPSAYSPGHSIPSSSKALLTPESKSAPTAKQTDAGTYSPFFVVPSPFHPNSLFPRSPTEEGWASSDPRQTNTPLYSRGTPEIENDECEIDEQAAVGRLSSLSLMAAVTASGAQSHSSSS